MFPREQRWDILLWCDEQFVSFGYFITTMNQKHKSEGLRHLHELI